MAQHQEHQSAWNKILTDAGQTGGHRRPTPA